MLLKLLLIILLIGVIITLVGAYDGVLAFFVLVFAIFGAVIWYYYEDFGYMNM